MAQNISLKQKLMSRSGYLGVQVSTRKMFLALYVPNEGLFDAQADTGTYNAGQQVVVTDVLADGTVIVTGQNLNLANASSITIGTVTIGMDNSGMKADLDTIKTTISSKYNPYATQTAAQAGLASALTYAQLNTISVSVIGLICTTAVTISLVGATSGNVYYTTTFPITATAMAPTIETLNLLLALLTTEKINLVITGTITAGNINAKIYGN